MFKVDFQNYNIFYISPMLTTKKIHTRESNKSLSQQKIDETQRKTAGGHRQKNYKMQKTIKMAISKVFPISNYFKYKLI